MNISKLPNVKYGEKFSEHRSLLIDAPTGLRSVVWGLATKYPTWSFYVASGNPRHEDFRAEMFDVRIDDEQVGSLHHVYYRRDYCIGISNKRIGKKLDYGTMMRTKDVAKAIQLAKKHFGKRSTLEVIDEACELVKGAMNGVVFRHDRLLRDAREPFDNLAKKYVFTTGLPQFKEYLGTQTNGSTLLKNLDDLFAMGKEKDVVDKLFSQYKNFDTCTVVLNSGTYIVENRNGIAASYTDYDLPDYVRGKIGLLKLVQVGQVVGGVGFRADDKTFLVVTNKEATC
jgi:hypothetical protein